MALVSARVDEDVLIRFAQKLACNEKKIRDRALNKLHKWIENRFKMETGGFTEEDLLKIWKGLHYSVWMSDKPLVQEDLTNSIASLILCFSNVDTSMLFIKVFFKTISREWFGIDRLRLDKFMMLVRKCLASSFVLLKKYGWDQTLVAQFMEVLHANILTGHTDSVPDGLKFHVVDIFLEELEKVAAGTLGIGEVQQFIDPYCIMLTQTTNKSLFTHIIKQVFHRILRQTVETLEDSEEASCTLQFDYETIHRGLFQLASNKTCILRNRAKIYDLVKRLRAVCDGTVVQADSFMTPLEMMLPVKNDTTQHLFAVEQKMNSSTHCKLQDRNYYEGHAKQNSLEEMEHVEEKMKQKVSEQKIKKKVNQKKIKKVNQKKIKKKVSEQLSEGNFGHVTEKSMSMRKRKHAVLETEENGTSGSGQLDVDARPKKTKQKKNDNIAATQKPTKAHFTESLRKNCEVAPAHEMNGYMERENTVSIHILQHNIGKVLTEPVPFIGTEGIGKDQSHDSHNEGTDALSEKSKLHEKKCKNVKKLNTLSASKESDITLTTNLTESAKQLKKNSPFASFSTSSTKSPLAAVFLKRAVNKVSPKTEPKKKKRKGTHSVTTTSLSTGKKKKVIFAMGKNTAQEFSDSFSASPVMPFNPVQKPSQGILKSPASLINSPVSVLPTKLQFLSMRSKAADFF